MARQFIQLSIEDCNYLLSLISTDTAAYCARQRNFAYDKIQKILVDPRSTRLGWLDVEYLMDLADDDTLNETEMQRELTKATLEEIRSLQETTLQSLKDVEEQRSARRLNRVNSAQHNLTPQTLKGGK